MGRHILHYHGLTPIQPATLGAAGGYPDEAGHFSGGAAQVAVRDMPVLYKTVFRGVVVRTQAARICAGAWPAGRGVPGAVPGDD